MFIASPTDYAFPPFRCLGNSSITIDLTSHALVQDDTSSTYHVCTEDHSWVETHQVPCFVHIQPATVRGMLSCITNNDLDDLVPDFIKREADSKKQWFVYRLNASIKSSFWLRQFDNSYAKTSELVFCPNKINGLPCGFSIAHYREGKGNEMPVVTRCHNTLCKAVFCTGCFAIIENQASLKKHQKTCFTWKHYPYQDLDTIIPQIYQKIQLEKTHATGKDTISKKLKLLFLEHLNYMYERLMLPKCPCCALWYNIAAPHQPNTLQPYLLYVTQGSVKRPTSHVVCPCGTIWCYLCAKQVCSHPEQLKVREKESNYSDASRFSSTREDYDAFVEKQLAGKDTGRISYESYEASITRHNSEILSYYGWRNPTRKTPTFLGRSEAGCPLFLDDLQFIYPKDSTLCLSTNLSHKLNAYRQQYFFEAIRFFVKIIPKALLLDIIHMHPYEDIANELNFLITAALEE